jgi:hypothetical protein
MTPHKEAETAVIHYYEGHKAELRLRGHTARRCRIEDRNAWLDDVLAGGAQGSRVVYVHHLIGRGTELFTRGGV